VIRQEGRDFSPREIVAYLDRYVIGQEKAKRAVAVALRKPPAQAASSRGGGQGDRSPEHSHGRSHWGG